MSKIFSTARSAFIAAVPRPFTSARITSTSFLQKRSVWANGKIPFSQRLHATRLHTLQKRNVIAMVSATTDSSAPVDCRIGDVSLGFRLTREEYVNEIGSMVRFWVHERTGANLLSVLNDDENKTFGVVFRTPAKDSTGVAHVLEHSVLCGSKKYPVKEPFVELMKSSLNTFLNAFTYPDKTCYPVASCNERDFYNLVDVYLDAVFHPNLTPDTLAQEGHHLDLEDPDGQVSIKGVVYNEMKGAYSSPDRVIAELSQRMLFPDTAYGVESGGHPRDIPDLTWEQFKGFYDDYYHPSNARMWFYGDDEESKRLTIANSFLKDFNRRNVSSAVGLQKPWTEPRSFEFSYDAGSGPDLSKKYMATINWLINTPVDEIDPSELLNLTVLNHILLSLSSSPLRKAMTDSQLGEDVIGGGLETDLRQMSFSVGLKGMTEESISRMEKVVLDVMKDAEKNGFSDRMVDASLNTIEFQLRENNTGRFPKGLSLMLRSLTTWLHDADPLTTLKYEAAVQNLKDRLARKEPVFQQAITKYFLSNPHQAFVTLKPDAEFSKKEDAAEQARIQSAVSKFTRKDYVKVASETTRLKKKQAAHDNPADIDKIPTLTRKDLSKKIKTVPFEKYEENGVTVYHHPLNTNGVVYVDMMLDMSHVPKQLLPLASIFVGALTELGTEKDDFATLQQKLGAETGGLSTSVFTSQLYAEDGNGPALTKLTVRGKATVSQIGNLMKLTGDVLTGADLNNKQRFRQLIIEERAGLESSLASSGHRVAASRLGAMFRSSLWADEEMGGVNFLKCIRELSTRVDKDWESVAAELHQLRKLIVTRDRMVVNFTTTADDFSKIRAALPSFLNRLPEKPEDLGQGWMSTFSLVPRENEGLIVPSAVNYVGKAANLYDLGFKLTGGHSVASRHLGTSYLWDTVRVQGGAYGGFCQLDVKSGMFLYLSYRDPNVNSTLKNYDNAPQFLSKSKLSDEELTRSVIGMIGSMDSYQLPDAKGFASTIRQLTGDNDQIRQQRRDEVLGVSNKDFKELGEALEAVKENGTVVVVGGEDALKKANEEGLGLSLEVLV